MPVYNERDRKNIQRLVKEFGQENESRITELYGAQKKSLEQQGVLEDMTYRVIRDICDTKYTHRIRAENRKPDYRAANNIQDPYAFIRETRKKLGLTQSDLADKANTTQGYISGLERGKKLMSILIFFRIMSALQIKETDYHGALMQLVEQYKD